VRSEVLTSIKIQGVVFQVVTPSSDMVGYQHFTLQTEAAMSSETLVS